MYWKAAIRKAPQSLLSSRLNNPSCLSLSWYKRYSSHLISFVTSSGPIWKPTQTPRSFSAVLLSVNPSLCSGLGLPSPRYSTLHLDLLEPHRVLTGPLLKLAQVCWDGISSTDRISLLYWKSGLLLNLTLFPLFGSVLRTGLLNSVK